MFYMAILTASFYNSYMKVLYASSYIWQNIFIFHVKCVPKT